MTKQLARKISAIRTTLGLSQAEFAERLGVSQSTAGRWEKGSIPAGDLLHAIAAMANTTVQRLLGTEDLGISLSGPSSPQAAINVPVLLPNASALAEMFAGLLAAIDVDPDEDERAQRLAMSFPSAFQATLFLQELPGSDKPIDPEGPPRVGGLDQQLKP
ncbi:helix-turn-helix transcriptional regulator [Novosphingobium resinovorum]|uniref:HTH cro/C1-type domain-containing protein n=1 Tax=Novosphingobium resinovorum TaxID=158500 RepID=A0A1D8A2M3_9SPHN|nr:helix-turn-helix domain-containing protein [Novosphingobium resinovorum]AOR76316.1 hypothetical protein BES08_05740 [Novosphingobium resinovorum]